MRKIPKTLKKVLLFVGIFAVLFLGVKAYSKYTALIRNPADFFESVTDVRVAIKKKFHLDNLWKERDRNNFRYCYGMKINGIWYNVPTEFFDLHNIEDPWNKHEVEFLDHVVQIGDYVVIAIADKIDKFDMPISDTLHTVPERPLEPYMEKIWEDSLSFYQYTTGRFYEGASWRAVSPPTNFVYFILPVDAITADYELTYTKLVEQDDGSSAPETFVLTGTEIAEILK